MVDFTNFETWMAETKQLRSHLFLRLKMFLTNHPKTKTETVVPGVIFAAYELHLHHCAGHGVTDPGEIAESWIKHCTLIPKVVAEEARLNHSRDPIGSAAAYAAERADAKKRKGEER